MTYDAYEISEWGGRPVELYNFSRGYLQWRFNSSQKDLFVSNQTWEAVPITRSAIEATTELNRTGISITVLRDNPVAELWRVGAPSEEILLTIYQYHEGDLELATIWLGRVIGVEWGDLTAKLTLEPKFTNVRRQGLRRRYQKTCPHVLYGSLCGLHPGTFKLLTACDSISGLIISVQNATSQGTTYYSGGYVEWETGSGIYERRYVVVQDGAYLTLNAPPHTLNAGDKVTLYPGCDHTISTCSTKYSNTLNYGGMPYIPTKNPFGGSPIY